jgi:hypothetical protein
MNAVKWPAAPYQAHGSEGNADCGKLCQITASVIEIPVLHVNADAAGDLGD